MTETPELRVKLDELRRRLGTDRLPMGELVERGADAKLAELKADESEQVAALKRLADQVRRGDTGTDLQAAIDVKYLRLEPGADR